MSAATYTTAQRRDIADAFREAREVLGARRNGYICVTLDKHCYSSGRELAKEVVEDRMQLGTKYHRGVCLQQWLHAEHGIDLDCTYTTLGKLHAYRLAWLDALIEEFSQP